MNTRSIVIYTILVVVIAIFFRSDTDIRFMVSDHLSSFNEFDAFIGQIVWITGASSGIGASLALDMCRARAQVVLSARRVDKLQEVVDACKALGDDVPIPLVLPMDVTDIDGHTYAVETVLQKFGKIDILILNAGRSQRKLAVETSIYETKSLFDLNFFSYVSLSNHVAPSMIEKHQGHIVIMSSISGKIATPIASSYSATKFALHGYYDAFRAENAKNNNISVTLICVGPVETEIGGQVIRAEGDKTLEEGKKMTAPYATKIMTKAIFHKQPEIWISDQPILVFPYIAHFSPMLYRYISVNIFGPNRVRILKEGGEVFSLKVLKLNIFSFKINLSNICRIT